MSVTIYQVGGAVRDDLLGVQSKDIDFAVECSSYDEMLVWLENAGFDIFLEQPEYMTARARFPHNWFEFGNKNLGGVTADFVVCRTEAHYSDARHPDNVGIGTIRDDLARRDFTMNAIARRADGSLLDPWGGQSDIERRVIRAVGDPYLRLHEDPLRALRALRFSITKDFMIDSGLSVLIESPELLAALVQSVSVERIREELFKMFKTNTPKTLSLLMNRYPLLGSMIFKNTDLWLKPTLEDR